MIKKLLSLAFVVSVLGANAQLLLVDNFKNYNTAGSTNGDLNGQNGWNNQYDAFNFGTGDAPFSNGTPYRGKIISANLSIPGFLQTDKVFYTGSNGDGIGKGFTTMSPTSGTVYVAVPFAVRDFKRRTDSTVVTVESNLLRLVNKAAAGDFPVTACRIFIKPAVGGFTLGVGKTLNSSSYKSSPTIIPLNTACLVIIKYTFNPGVDDDQVSLYINPNLSIPENMNIPEVSALGTTDAPIIQGVNFNFNNLNSPFTYIGGIYASTTWPSIQNALPTNCINNLQLVKTANDKAKLVWNATNCKQIENFTIQTGLEANKLSNNSIVKSKGDGNYSSEFNLQQGTNFVRLVTTDLNGQNIYSPVLSVKNGGIIKGLELYPNPTHKQLNITLKAEANQEATLQIFNVEGKLVYQNKRQLQAGQNVLSVDVAHLVAGMYTFKSTIGLTEIESKNFIKN